MLADSDFYANPVVTWLTFAATLTAAVILARVYSWLVDTTLLVPWIWTFTTFAFVAMTSLYAWNLPGLRERSTFVAIQFLAACGTFCPFVALVGAKRPQHAVWSLVVGSLWCILALPAAEVVLLQPGQNFEINSFRGWFLWVLLAAELSSFLLTRYSLSAILLVLGQIVWLERWLPLGPFLPSNQYFDSELLGLILVAVSIFTAWAIWLRHTEASNAYDRLWFNFRDSFGLFWSLRLIERVNDTAKQAGWDFDLGWGGFRTKEDFKPLDKLPPEIDAALRNCLQGSLRRFVSREWIAQQLGGEVESTSTETSP